MRNSNSYFPQGSSGPGEKVSEFAGNARLADNDGWFSWAADGKAATSLSLQHGTGATPSENVTSMGIYIPKDAILKRLELIHRFDSGGVNTLDVFLRADVSDFNNVATNIAANRITDVVLPVTALNVGVGSSNFNITEIDLTNYVMPEDGMVYPYFRAQGTFTGTRSMYFDARIIWE